MVEVVVMVKEALGAMNVLEKVAVALEEVAMVRAAEHHRPQPNSVNLDR